MRLLRGIPPVLLLALSACGSAEPRAAAPRSSPRAPGPEVSGKPRDPVSVGQLNYDASRYREAETAFRRAGEDPAAILGLAKVALITGKHAEAERLASQLSGTAAVVEAAWIRGEALRRKGRLRDAALVLGELADKPEARRVRLLLGEVLLEDGKREEAERVLMTFIEDYNEERVASDPAALGRVGRAAQLLGSAHDANDAFNEAEKAGKVPTETLLHRAELFLDNYDEGHAEEVLNEILQLAPNHPQALVWMAQVKLSQNLDFDAAKRLAKKALAVDPTLSSAFFVLAGIALRDLDFKEAEAHVEAGLSHNPRELSLLSMRAAIRFLADDTAGFDRAKRDVLDKNPRYSEMYRVVGEYADWEHRYEEIVELMREGLLANAADPKIRAQLGINLIRLGDDQGGVAALRRAFEDDPFNARVFNTLNLFEKTIPAHYTSVASGHFVVRYHNQEKPVLERYVPALLDKGFQKMTAAYGFKPKVPIGVELYPEREHFAVRTSGLPHTYIQGVCFGRTLAAMTPGKEQFNFGMTLWHELAHVFHIQLSNSRVPRWFTEGLAEYETLTERTEWQREHDLELYDALRLGRLPRVAAMNEAFSHARDMDDMAIAYYASAQIVTMMAERYGRESLRRMLELWRAGKSTPEVVQTALRTSADELDAQFRSWVKKRLERYASQFIPIGRADDVEVALERLKKNRSDPEALVRYAHALFAAQQETEGERALAKALELDPKQPDAVWLAAQRALSGRQVAEAERRIRALLADGKDGYPVQMMLARISEARGKRDGVRRALEAAHRFDPTQTEPLTELAEMHRSSKDTQAELEVLRKLSAVEQHDPSVYRMLLRALIQGGHIEEAVRVGESAIHVDLEGLETHLLYAQALEAAGKLDAAIFELTTAALCRGSADQLAEVNRRLGELRSRPGASGASRSGSARHAR